MVGRVTSLKHPVLLATVSSGNGKLSGRILEPPTQIGELSCRVAQRKISPGSNGSFDVVGVGFSLRTGSTFMNKSDLTRALAKAFALPARKAEQIVDMVFDTMNKTHLYPARGLSSAALGLLSSMSTTATRGEIPRPERVSRSKANGCPFSRLVKSLRNASAVSRNLKVSRRPGRRRQTGSPSGFREGNLRLQAAIQKKASASRKGRTNLRGLSRKR